LCAVNIGVWKAESRRDAYPGVSATMEKDEEEVMLVRERAARVEPAVDKMLLRDVDARDCRRVLDATGLPALPVRWLLRLPALLESV